MILVRYGFFQDASGDLSMNRLGAFMGFCLGATVAVGGLVAFIFGPAKTEAGGVIALGCGMFGGAGWLKEHGKKQESRSQS